MVVDELHNVTVSSPLKAFYSSTHSAHAAVGWLPQGRD
jgi:hypothetical protein